MDELDSQNASVFEKEFMAVEDFSVLYFSCSNFGFKRLDEIVKFFEGEFLVAEEVKIQGFTVVEIMVGEECPAGPIDFLHKRRLTEEVDGFSLLFGERHSKVFRYSSSIARFPGSRCFLISAKCFLICSFLRPWNSP